jgi:hypothetical protein
MQNPITMNLSMLGWGGAAAGGRRADPIAGLPLTPATRLVKAFDDPPQRGRRLDRELRDDATSVKT